jgi:hypothetical protein
VNSVERADLIKSNPIKEELVAFRQQFQLAGAHLGLVETNPAENSEHSALRAGGFSGAVIRLTVMYEI